ncbi:Zinc transporter ZupT [Lentilactobacillus parabuchneri]|jgi:ZIP family zinc transporter|uniref:ZIP family metal transporter n=3 Tax=Lentilactobacillus TaxID=2767893 RepID=A0A1X1FER3_9LACO|nr:ZIP family metal transporter [Lentilactobacillus parabuchneri]APR07502.1 Zinc transporter ZupT [Lentilactobacillus parabuchneri]KRM46296.1 zinc iron permease [Lentilactobacillus parabuchneri DSM 5707 = NBRC 107865]KRN72947.1 zinc iron permease [Lentilactobacillus parabuchneri]MBW0223933.1 ZIP family metal transporter [Lentilactobacillus parabuchneri]MBW0245882.1 ZIP family metal transporter [Lentilactobacillus parabuchneri]
MDYLLNFSPWQQALFATLFTWGVTALGSALVFAFKTIRSHALALMYGFAAGVMIAASFWSLLDPAINLAEQQDRIPWLVVGIGFVGGGFFLYLADKIIPSIYLKHAKTEGGSRAAVKRAILLVFSITLHNIPEGLAVGVAFGAIGAAPNGEQAAMLLAATTVAIGIGLQNFPEGAAVSIPLRQGGMSRFRSFMYGQASGAVEPIAGVLGALLVASVNSLLPYALSFAAGAMIYVACKELIPEAHARTKEESHWAIFGIMAGFTLMMVLDVALG